MSTATLSLYNIENELFNLLRFREDLLADPDIKPSELNESLAAVDMQIREYIGAEVKKVDGIAAMLREFESRAAIDKAEAKRLKERADAWGARHDRLEEMTREIMQSKGLTKLEGTHNTFLLKKNPPAVEIAQPGLVPLDYQRVTVKLPAAVWSKVKASLPVEVAVTLASVTEDMEPVKADIKEALKSKCEGCGGAGTKEVRTLNMMTGDKSEVRTVQCEACGGSGLKGVPGCRMRPETNRLEIK